MNDEEDGNNNNNGGDDSSGVSSGCNSNHGSTSSSSDQLPRLDDECIKTVIDSCEYNACFSTGPAAAAAQDSSSPNFPDDILNRFLRARNSSRFVGHYIPSSKLSFCKYLLNGHFTQAFGRQSSNFTPPQLQSLLKVFTQSEKSKEE